MKIPPRFTTRSSTNKESKLKKALYKLKQSPRAWFGKFVAVIQGMNTSKAKETILGLKGNYSPLSIC